MSSQELIGPLIVCVAVLGFVWSVYRWMIGLRSAAARGRGGGGGGGAGGEALKQSGKPPRASMPMQRNPDQYSTVDEVQEALRYAGLESAQLILAVDFTRSNE